jgi:hypothetical protein
LSFKVELDNKVNEAERQLAILEKHLPTFFRQTKSPSSERQPEMLKDSASPKEWRMALLQAQMDVKFLAEGFSDTREAFMEITRKIVELFHELKEGYDVQGRVLLALARKSDIDFDRLLEMYTNDVQGEANTLEEFPQ